MADSVHWYGHVLRREDGHILRRALDYEVEGQGKEARPKFTLFGYVVVCLYLLFSLSSVHCSFYFSVLFTAVNGVFQLLPSPHCVA